MESISPPSFLPYQPSSDSPCPLASDTEPWTEILVSNCHFGLTTFLAVLKDLCLHPERNSNLILRADGLPLKGIRDDEVPRYAACGSDTCQGAKGQRMEVVEEIRVRLMPRQPNRDGKLDQRCLFFRTPAPAAISEHHTANGTGGVAAEQAERAGKQAPEHKAVSHPSPSVSSAHTSRQQAYVIYAPESSSREDQPYYYPPVRKLAYRYETLLSAEAEAAHAEVVRAEKEKRREAKRKEWQRSRSKVMGTIKAKMNAGVAITQEQRQMLEAGTGRDAEVNEGEGEDEGQVELNIPPVVGRISIAYLPWDTPPPLADTAVADGQRASKPKKRSPLAASGAEQEDSKENEAAVRAIEGLPAEGDVRSGCQLEAARKAEAVKLQRVCLNLLERVYRCGFGQMNGYQKRMNHDVVVPRDAFQDLYLKLKERHRHLESRKPNPKARVAKDEDVKRHVYKLNTDPSLPHDPPLPTSRSAVSFATTTTSSTFAAPTSPLNRLRNAPIVPLPSNGHPTDISDWGGQDVAIAAFLMLLWRDMYPSRVAANGEAAAQGSDVESTREWDSWGRPEGGFVDLGCGNGLLVHVLTAEGYAGKGYELRARRTWPTYPPATQANLIELPIDFPSWFPETMDEWDDGVWAGKEGCAIKEDCFIIGNHADEITPWIPLLSLLTPTPTPFLSLPCCTHMLDAIFTRPTFVPPPHEHMPADGLDAGLEKGQSKYKAYLMYLGYQGLMCGWEWEKEGLRVPSTRGWGIVGRNRWAKTPEQLRQCRQWALEQVQGVRDRGAFRVREKEGKDH